MSERSCSTPSIPRLNALPIRIKYLKLLSNLRSYFKIFNESGKERSRFGEFWIALYIVYTLKMCTLLKAENNSPSLNFTHFLGKKNAPSYT